jgi:hypothetical protein
MEFGIQLSLEVPSHAGMDSGTDSLVSFFVYSCIVPDIEFGLRTKNL